MIYYDVYICTSWTDAHSGSNSWTQLNGSSKGAASAFTRVVEWRPNGATQFPTETAPVGSRSGGLASTSTVYGEMRGGVLRIRSTYGGADTGADLRAEMQDEWSTLLGLVSPADGEILLRLDRPNRSGTTLSRLLICRVGEAMEWAPPNERADTQGVVVDFPLEVRYPYYLTRVVADTDYASVGTSFVSATIANSGHTDGLGLTVNVTAKNSGSPTIITLENTTTGQTLVWTIATTVSVSDKLSWFGTDPRKVQITTTNASHLGASAAGQNPALVRGNNTIKLKVNSGSIDAEIWTADEFYTV